MSSPLRSPSTSKRAVTAGRAAALLGGVAAGVAGALLRRRSGAASSPPSPAGPSAPSPPATGATYDTSAPPPSADAPLVVDATAEPIGIDEDAEVEAAAAEAANIGGPPIDYAGAQPDLTPGEPDQTVPESGLTDGEPDQSLPRPGAGLSGGEADQTLPGPGSDAGR